MKVILGGLAALCVGGASLALLAATGAIAVPDSLQELYAQAETTTPVQPPAPAAAAPANWVVNCVAGQAGLDCRAISSLPLSRTGPGIVSVVVRNNPETKKPIMSLVLPLGLHLPAGVTLEFAGGEPKRLAFLNCDQAGCLAEHQITEAEIDSLVKGRGLTVAVLTREQQAMSVPVPGAGFAAAYAKVK